MIFKENATSTLHFGMNIMTLSMNSTDRGNEIKLVIIFLNSHLYRMDANLIDICTVYLSLYLS